MTHITKEEVLKLAALSHIALYEDEAEALARDLEAVLTYASSLQDVARTYQGPRLELIKNTNITRDDVPQLTPFEPLLAQAPEREGNYIVVPKIIKN